MFLYLGKSPWLNDVEGHTESMEKELPAELREGLW